MAPTFSVVVPVFNESESIGGLLAEIAAALESAAPYEVIVVDDASTDGTAECVRALKPGWAGRLRLLRHAKNLGQSAGLRTGVRAARAEWIVTMDGDGQNDPADIHRLLEALKTAPGVGLVCGQRRLRHDPWSKRVSSRIANGFRARVLRDRTPDTGCGLKVFERGAFLNLPFFDHIHRFIPALMISAGVRTISVEVRHRPRVHGSSKYGFHDRLWCGLTDMLGVSWLMRRSKDLAYEELGDDADDSRS